MEELAGVHLLILRVLGESIPYQLTHHLQSILVGGDGCFILALGLPMSGSQPGTYHINISQRYLQPRETLLDSVRIVQCA